MGFHGTKSSGSDESIGDPKPVKHPTMRGKPSNWAEDTLQQTAAAPVRLESRRRLGMPRWNLLFNMYLGRQWFHPVYGHTPFVLVGVGDSTSWKLQSTYAIRFRGCKHDWTMMGRRERLEVWEVDRMGSC